MQQETNTQRYWRNVKIQTEKIFEEIQSRVRKSKELGNDTPLQGQFPHGRAVYVTSIERPDFPAGEWCAGRVSICSIERAGRAVVDMMHRLSTAEEIEAFLLEQTQRRESALREEALLNNRRTITVQAAPPKARLA